MSIWGFSFWSKRCPAYFVYSIKTIKMDTKKKNKSFIFEQRKCFDDNLKWWAVQCTVNFTFHSMMKNSWSLIAALETAYSSTSTTKNSKAWEIEMVYWMLIPRINSMKPKKKILFIYFNMQINSFACCFIWINPI